MMPSTFATATIGGFVAGGSGGIGSCTWGALRDFGNIIRLRVVTMEAEPRVLDLTATSCPASPTPSAPTGSSPRSRCRWPRL
jgi:FAD/FMN-containing dehydrogenase